VLYYIVTSALLYCLIIERSTQLAIIGKTL